MDSVIPAPVEAFEPAPDTLPDPNEPEHDRDCPVEHECSYQRFVLPGEPSGRVYQCTLCRAIGFRRPRFRGLGKVVHYTCSRPHCQGVARQRLHGRGPRGAYIWACVEHAVTIQIAGPIMGHDRNE